MEEELKRQEDDARAQAEARRVAMQNQQRQNRNQMMTSATIFSDESENVGGRKQHYAFTRNAGQEQIEKYKSHYLNLQIFL